MLHTVVVALDERTVATLVMGESGPQTLYIRSAKSPLDSVTLELDKAAVQDLATLLGIAQEASNRGAKLTAETQYKLETADSVIRVRQSTHVLPF